MEESGQVRKKRQALTHGQMNTQNWRYKKKRPPVDEFAHLNGEVKIIKPATNPRFITSKGSPVPYIPPHIRAIMREEG